MKSILVYQEANLRGMGLYGERVSQRERGSAQSKEDEEEQSSGGLFNFIVFEFWMCMYISRSKILLFSIVQTHPQTKIIFGLIQNIYVYCFQKMNWKISKKNLL